MLTDGEPTLAHYMDQLREAGYRVLATARPYEAILFVTREDVQCVLAREALLPDRSGEFLRRLREAEPAPFVVLLSPESGTPAEPSPHADLQLNEPFRYSTLVEALNYAAARQANRPAPTPRSTAVDSSPKQPTGLFGLRGARLLACARRLSELERDRDQLLTVALEMFLELSDAERGTLLIATEDQKLEVVRRSGYEDGIVTELGVAERYAPEVAGDHCPRIILSVPQPEGQHPSGTTSCLVVPILDQRQLAGVVALSDRRGGEMFNETDLEAVTTLSRQFVVNLANASQFAEVQRMAVVDPLTGLFNRRYFERQIVIELERARRYSRQVTLAIIDIDKFKIFNDLNGYGTGDLVIRSVAQVIRASFREVDIVTRWGGDEFAIILPETGKPRPSDVGHGRNYVERVRASVEAHRFDREIAAITGSITISAGVATYPVDTTSADQLFQLANQALLRAKRAGHNRVCIAEPEREAQRTTTREGAP